MDELLRALERYNHAQRAHDDAYSKYEGHSWGYFGYCLIEARDEARKDFEKTFITAVQAEVEKVLKEKGIIRAD